MEMKDLSSSAMLAKFESWRKSQTRLVWTIFPHPVFSKKGASFSAKVLFVDTEKERVQFVSQRSDADNWLELSPLACTPLGIGEDFVELLPSSGTRYEFSVAVGNDLTN